MSKVFEDNENLIAAIILTKNEELHIERCINSIRSIADYILVVDSGSDDSTVSIATNCGASVLENHWINYATQFNWALGNLPSGISWVLRIDADEVMLPELSDEIIKKLPKLSDHVVGVNFTRLISFQGDIVKFGSLSKSKVLRLFRNGAGFCEIRWMDEHIKVNGEILSFDGVIVDENKKSLSWWIQKHNSYASREAVDLLNLEYLLSGHDSVASVMTHGKAGRVRWVKEKIYRYLPTRFRSFVYFFVRYFILFGFLDRRGASDFHILQGFWYRYLVDAKVREVKRYAKVNGVELKKSIEIVLDIKL
jgi:glycosyltransferase involved in cell wall biosynthesis